MERCDKKGERYTDVIDVCYVSTMTVNLGPPEPISALSRDL